MTCTVCNNVTVVLDGDRYVKGAYATAYEILAARLGRRPAISFSRDERLGMIAQMPVDGEDNDALIKMISDATTRSMASLRREYKAVVTN